MKKLIIFFTLIFSLTAQAGIATCKGQDSWGTNIEVSFGSDFVVVKSERAKENVFFTNVQSSWDGHGAGMVIGHKELIGEGEDLLISIRYDNHFGVVQNVTILTSFNFDGLRPGNFSEARIAECQSDKK